MKIANSFKFLLVFTYLFFAVFFITTIAYVFKWTPILLKDHVVFLIIAGTAVLGFTGVYWFTPWMLIRMNVRKTILEEEHLLNSCMQVLKQKTGDTKRYRLLILEEDELSAFAIGHNTIAVSRGLLRTLDSEELTAVLAHEMGHLRAKDTYASTAYFLASYLPTLTHRYTTFFFKRLKRNFLINTIRHGLLIAILAILILALIAHFLHILPIIEGLAMLALLFFFLNKSLGFLWLLDSRYTEYRQDSFAQKLGYGLPLKTALLKIIENTPPQRVSLLYIYMKGSHPVSYNRIRKLEKKEGLR